MKKLVLVWTLLLSLHTLFAQTYEPNEFLVMLKPGYSQADILKVLNSKGLLGQFYLKEVSSDDYRIYLIGMDEVLGEPQKYLSELNDLNMVIAAQLNYHVQSRATPNDPSYATQQWALNNTGQGGGTVDADIDAPEAWDITTGGVTAAGDTIVVAVVDGGFYLNHPDLLPNYFINRHEIPNNGIDDDGNGYVDDYRGWNAYNNNATLPQDNHGTHVAGIIGAKGNNNLGVSGVNWNVKIMPIAGSSGTTNIVVRAYTYAAKMRRIYNQTNGTEGAFVVATNASFGVDYGAASAYPIWCAFYDSLGTLGILSMGAGPNANTNIDTQGDIPTTCPSNYLIAVTNSTRNDVKTTQAGYGIINMDLAAPGTQIYNTYSTNTYQALSGTSMATPTVTGVVALMYAAACEQFIIDYKANPGPMALQMRQWLLDSVDVKATFASQVATSGRLNAHKALKAVQTYVCSVSAAPEASFTASASSTCTPSTVTYTNASTGSNMSYQWTFPGGTPASSTLENPTVTYNTGGTYNATLVVTNSGGTDTYTLTNAVTVNQTPPTPVITDINGVLNSSATSGNQWYANGTLIPGATSQTYTPSSGGSIYTVVVTENACSSSPSNAIVSTVGNEEIENLSLQVFPNPSSGEYTLTWNHNNQAQVRVLDMQGRVVKDFGKLNTGNKISIQEFAEGMYLIDLRTDKENHILKIQLVK